MSDIDVINEILRAHDIDTVGEVIFDAEDLRQYFVSIAVVRNRDNRQVPSNRRLNEIKKHLNEKGILVTFLLRDSVAQDLETGLRATLLHSHIEHIRNVFLSIDGRVGHVWVEQKRELTHDQVAEMAKRAKEFLSLSELTLGSFSSISDASLPSQMACLVAIRTLSPASSKEISELLRQKGFNIPSDHWLTRRMDVLRRAGKIVRLGSGLYTLSAETLRALGTSKTRCSPDISRMLALAKRRG